MKRTLSVVSVLVVIALMAGGCASPEQRAQKLFDAGKYEEIMAKYANLPVAAQAKEKIAEKLLADGKFEEIMANYADTKFVGEAKNRIAAKLVAEKKYDEVLAKYADTPAANEARNQQAQMLYDGKKVDELVAKYPNTPAGMKARNEMAAAEWEKVSKLGKKDKIAKIEEFVKNPKFGGTETMMKAQEELNKLKPAPKAATAPAKPVKK